MGLFILLLQVPFVFLKLTIVDPDFGNRLLETLQILVSSGLVASLFSKGFDSFLENWMYGGFRRNWKEVRVMYSDDALKGTGRGYPREPTLLIQPPVGQMGAAPELFRKDSLVARNLDGKICVITAPIVHGPMLISFNTGYVGQPVAGEGTKIEGKWSQLQLMQVGPTEISTTQVGFPDTLYTSGSA